MYFYTWKERELDDSFGRLHATCKVIIGTVVIIIIIEFCSAYASVKGPLDFIRQ